MTYKLRMTTDGIKTRTKTHYHGYVCRVVENRAKTSSQKQYHVHIPIQIARELKLEKGALLEVIIGKTNASILHEYNWQGFQK
jgi:hypothetical protein